MFNTTATVVPVCPCCGGTEFADFKTRKKAKCTRCGSVERIRAAYMFLQRYVKPQRGWRVLHLAPEPSIGRHLEETVGEGYTPADFSVPRYQKYYKTPVLSIDLCKDAKDLPSDHYDLLMHNHVLEHLPCNFTLALQHLHRAVKPGGYHMFSVPIWHGYSSEDFDPEITPDTRNEVFLHPEHLRRFGRKDFDSTFGPILGIPSDYSLLNYFTAEELHGAAIPEKRWKLSGTSIFLLRK